MDPVEEFQVGEKTIKIFHDENVPSPREESDHLGTMLYASRRYVLGDVAAQSAEELYEVEHDRNKIVLPLYLMDHSGQQMNTTGYGCQWDSGLVGFIYVDKAKVREEYGCKRISAKIRERVLDVLRAEVEEFSQYLQGDVYGYCLMDEDNVMLSSCWGFYGMDYCRSEARDEAEAA